MSRRGIGGWWGWEVRGIYVVGLIRHGMDHLQSYVVMGRVKLLLTYRTLVDES